MGLGLSANLAGLGCPCCLRRGLSGYGSLPFSRPRCADLFCSGRRCYACLSAGVFAKRRTAEMALGKAVNASHASNSFRDALDGTPRRYIRPALHVLSSPALQATLGGRCRPGVAADRKLTRSISNARQHYKGSPRRRLRVGRGENSMSNGPASVQTSQKHQSATLRPSAARPPADRPRRCRSSPPVGHAALARAERAVPKR